MDWQGVIGFILFVGIVYVGYNYIKNRKDAKKGSAGTPGKTSEEPTHKK